MQHHISEPTPDAGYREAFSRNLGILTEQEQDLLSASTVLIVGVGGIGSNCAAILARMGVGGFHLVDPDIFEHANINRQYGAKHSTVGRYKVDVLRDEILDINPAADVRTWKVPFTTELADAVFGGADICIDAIDFYCIDDHITFHRIARSKGCYVLMGSPVGFSATLQVFAPDGMSLEEYCGITDDQDAVEKQLRYACGIVPRLAHIGYYDVSKQNSNTDFLKGSGPSLGSACALAASFVAGEIVMTLLGRRRPRAIPHTLQHDPYTFRNEAVYVDGGMPAYDPTEVLEKVEDKSSLVVNIFDHFYRKVRAELLPLPDGGSLCYRSEGKGRHVVLIPPVGGDTSFWARQTPTLAARHRVITLDNRGVGRSSGLPADADTALMAKDVLALIDALALDRPIIVGCALGGLIALQCALLRPDAIAGVSLCSAYAEADDMILETTERWRELALKKGMQAVFDDSIDWLFCDDYRSEHADEIYKLKTFYRVNEQHPEEFCRQSRIANRFKPIATLDEVRCPVQVVHGEQDCLVQPHLAHDLAARLGASEPRLLAGAGHFLTWEQAAPYNRLLLDFIEDIDRGGPVA